MNQRPLGPKPSALPTELHPDIHFFVLSAVVVKHVVKGPCSSKMRGKVNAGSPSIYKASRDFEFIDLPGGVTRSQTKCATSCATPRRRKARTVADPLPIFDFTSFKAICQGKTAPTVPISSKGKDQAGRTGVFFTPVLKNAFRIGIIFCKKNKRSAPLSRGTERE